MVNSAVLTKDDRVDQCSLSAFQIGFQSYKENVCIKSVDIEAVKEGKGKLTFDGKSRL